MLSCLLGGHMRVGMEDNTRMPNGELAKGSYEQVEWCVKVAGPLGREPAAPSEAQRNHGDPQEIPKGENHGFSFYR